MRPKSLGLSLAYWLEWLRHAPHDASIRLRRAILSEDLPEHLLHHFACDSVAHILSLAQHTRHALPPEVGEAVEARRRWIEGALSWDDFSAHHVVPLQDLLRERRYSHSHHLLRAVRSLFLPEAHLAAIYSTAPSLFPNEQEWYCQRLQHHLETHQRQLQRLAHLLTVRRYKRNPHEHAWRQDLEDALFRG